ncbi:flagellar brake protein [Pseudoxanthomonas wuyuanensis]|uniref:Flagellar brake protein YcgR n=1 Tax=Pseudoxanthomonas wuyuanensis TaxID=1073196 RepID=A0A286DH68_9GAMM|nr:flagellar brake protein [Pseudoxanthomonas wuyuanensis]KAF1714597.1 flagellar brake protein [Pseudoxanthomonas wuyuanensis]SOD57971.1 c-di-GMP-binding flagellar brake protein YcgR, contains PilZNR and PilZ domains [Pseudoxanthomonas wuyuanensis]
MSEDTDSGRIEPVRYDEEEKYLLRNPREIRQVLQSLLDRRSLISAYPAPRHHTYPTALIALDEDSGQLLIDGSLQEPVNRIIEQAHHLTCVAQLDRIHIQFRLSQPVRTMIDGQTAFRTAVPEQLLRLQRREFYRLQVPLTQPLTCELPLPRGDGETEPLPLRVLDISGGGVALAVPADRPDFQPFREYDNCYLHLPDADPIPLRLMIRSLFRQVGHNGRETWRAGCQFTALPRGAEVLIQRYIFRMERQRSARERGIA